MADVAVVLDTAGLAGLQAGKRGHKKTGEAADQADFVLALISQISAGDVAKGQALKLVPAAACASASASGEGRLARADPLISAPQSAGKAPVVAFPDEATAVDRAIPAESREEDQQAVTASSAPTELLSLAPQSPPPPPPAATPVATLAPASPLSSVPQSSPDAESTFKSSSSAPLAAAVQAISVNLAKEAPAAPVEELDAPVLVAQPFVPGDAKRSGSEGLKTVNFPGLPANTADGDGRSGQVLPAIGAEMANSDPGAFQDQPDGMANPALVTTASSGTLASPEATMARPFDQVLRHMETRLNVSVEAHVKSPAFANELGEKVVWLAGRNGQIAELTLNPPQMGSVEIRLTVAGGEAGAQFFSANPAVREALETALPKLRELMAQAGINLGEANVRDQSFAQGKAAARSEAGASSLLPGSEAANEGMSLGFQRSGGLGLVDLYA